MMRTICILGCGWLGEPLAHRLLDAGYRVKGTTTTEAKLERLAAAGVDPYLLRLSEAPLSPSQRTALEADVLFLNVPPSRTPDGPAAYEEQVRALLREVERSPIRRLLLASSTSVYAREQGTVTEGDAGPATALCPTGRHLLRVERCVQGSSTLTSTILRYGGLYGYDRHPGRFLAGRTGLGRPEAPVNLVHRDDAVGVALEVLRQDAWGEVFNVCADEHPTRRDVYVAAAQRLGLEPPTFVDEAPRSYTLVSNERVKRRLGYAFRVPDPRGEAP